MRCWWGLLRYGRALDTGPHHYQMPAAGAGSVGRSAPFIGSGAPLSPPGAVRAAPGKGPHSTNIFSQGSGLGGLQLYPLTAAPPARLVAGGIIVSGAFLCMGGLLLTVCASINGWGPR